MLYLSNPTCTAQQNSVALPVLGYCRTMPPSCALQDTGMRGFVCTSAAWVKCAHLAPLTCLRLGYQVAGAPVLMLGSCLHCVNPAPLTCA